MRRSTSLVVVSGLAGAGKSAALNSLEDLGYYCVDNLPSALMSKFADLCEKTGNAVDRAALVIDARTYVFVGKFAEAYEELQARAESVELVFLDADDAVLQQRYSETRRPHPWAGEVRIGRRPGGGHGGGHRPGPLDSRFALRAC